jgi:hypothetical protein
MIFRRVKKAWFKSKTIICNIIAVLPPVIIALMPVLGMAEFQALIPRDWFKYYTILLALLNLWLRTRTTEPLGAHDDFEVTNGEQR